MMEVAIIDIEKFQSYPGFQECGLEAEYLKSFMRGSLKTNILERDKGSQPGLALKVEAILGGKSGQVAERNEVKVFPCLLALETRK